MESITSIEISDDSSPLSYRTLDPTQKFFFTPEEYEDMQRGIIIVAQEDEESPLNKILRDNLQTRNNAKKVNKNNKSSSNRSKENNRNGERQDEDEEEEDMEESFMFEENRSRFSVIANYFDCIVDGCENKFIKKKDRNNHVRTAHEIEPYGCPIGDCNERTNNSHQYAKHLVQKHPDIQQWTCDKCSTIPKFPNYQSFWKHNYTLHESGEFGCPYKDCKFTAKVRKPVYNHITHKHPDLKYVCHHEGCDKVFANPSEMMSHQLRAHLFLKPFKCTWPDCGYSSEVSSATLRHIRAVHFNVPSLKVQRETNMVDQRDPRDYLQRLVDPKRILACFGPIDKNDKDKMFKCSQCSQVYRRKFNLMVHERIHTGVKPFRCIFDECHQLFARREHAFSHIRTTHFNLKSRRSKKRDRNEIEIDVNQYIEVVPEQIVQPETIIVEEENASTYHHSDIVDSIEDLQGQMFFIQTSDQEGQLVEFVTEDDQSAIITKDENDKGNVETIANQNNSEAITNTETVYQQEFIDKNSGEIDETVTQTPLTNLLIHTGNDDKQIEVINNYEEEVPPTKKIRSKAKMYYICTYDDCQRKFSRPAALRQHIRTHSGKKPFSCGFTSSDLLLCDFTSGRKENLIQHIRTRHFNLPRSLKKQQQLNIIDDRDPLQYVRVDSSILDDNR